MNLENPRKILLNAARINIILGKNGCGKSFLLKHLEQNLHKQDEVGMVRYISPERGGELLYQSGIQDAIENDRVWLENTRRNNQTPNFRQQSIALSRRLELSVLRKIAKTHNLPDYQPISFEEVLQPLQELLDRVYLKITDPDPVFKIYKKNNDQEVAPKDLSSGESELISLAIEVLAFKHECDPSKINYFIIDEPDAHLHPDLQARFAAFLMEVLNSENITIILATHSTALLSALSCYPETRVAFMTSQNLMINFININEELKCILPIFGAHPLSNVFNQMPILLVEGTDDERLWQQAVRSSNGALQLYPCSAGSINKLHRFEETASSIMAAVYDNARGFSIRDCDDCITSEIEDAGPIIRMRLCCRASENLLLSDDVLSCANTNWETMKNVVTEWVQNFSYHPFYSDMKTFVDDGMDRRYANLKDIRNILIGLITKKPWEVLVGQTIAELVKGNGIDSENSLREYLGEKICINILKISAPLTEQRI